MMKYLEAGEMDSPIGKLLLASTENGLCFIEFGGEESAWAQLNRWRDKWLSGYEIVKNFGLNQQAIGQLEEYFAGQRQVFDLSLDLYGTSFQKTVWLELYRIPYGEVRSYRDVATAIGNPKAVRAVGGANNKNPIPVIIPCHRVIGSNGSMVGYGGGVSIKEHLLQVEAGLIRGISYPVS